MLAERMFAKGGSKLKDDKRVLGPVLVRKGERKSLVEMRSEGWERWLQRVL